MMTRSLAIDLAVLGAIGAVAIGGVFLLDQTVRKTIGAPGLLDKDVAWAATTATVSATVKFQTFSVSVTDGSISYGSLAASATRSTLPSSLNDQQKAQNDGNATENVNLRGYNSANWTLVQAAPAGDQYRHQFSSNEASGYNNATVNFTLFYGNLSVGAANDATLDLQITMPTTDASGGATQDVSVTLQAVAP